MNEYWDWVKEKTSVEYYLCDLCGEHYSPEDIDARIRPRTCKYCHLSGSDCLRLYGRAGSRERVLRDLNEVHIGQIGYSTSFIVWNNGESRRVRVSSLGYFPRLGYHKLPPGLGKNNKFLIRTSDVTMACYFKPKFVTINGEKVIQCHPDGVLENWRNVYLDRVPRQFGVFVKDEGKW